VSPTPRQAANRRVIALVVLIIALGAFLRLYGLTAQSLWNDELSSYVRSHFDRAWPVIDDGARYDGHPPGYLLLLFGVQKLFGHSEIALRLPSAIAGIISIWLIYLLGRRLYSWREGVIAAGLMAVLWAPVYYSQEARPYAFVILLSLLTTYLWLPFVPSSIVHRPSLWSTAGYVLAALAAAYMHYFGLLLVTLQGATALFFALRARRGIVRVLVSYALVLIGYSPWLTFVGIQLGTQFAAPLPRPSLGIFVEFFRHIFYGPVYLVLLVLALYGLALGVIVYRKISGRGPLHEPTGVSWSSLLLVAWLAAPMIVAFLESWLLLPIIQLRYLLICLPPAYLLLARAVVVLPLRGWGRRALAVGLIACFLLVLVGPIHYYSRPSKEQFRGVVAYVVRHDAAYPGALIVGSVWHADYLNYYFEQLGSARRTDLVAGNTEDLPLLVARMNARQPHYVWLVSAHLVPAPELLAYLDSHMTLVDYRQFLGAAVWLYENRGAQ